MEFRALIMFFILAVSAFFVFPWPIALWAIGALLYFGWAIGRVLEKFEEKKRENLQP